MCVHQLSAISVNTNCLWVEHNKLFLCGILFCLVGISFRTVLSTIISTELFLFVGELLNLGEKNEIKSH